MIRLSDEQTIKIEQVKQRILEHFPDIEGVFVDIGKGTDDNNLIWNIEVIKGEARDTEDDIRNYINKLIEEPDFVLSTGGNTIMVNAEIKRDSRVDGAADYIKEFLAGWSGQADEYRFWQWIEIRHPNYNEEDAKKALEQLKKQKKVIAGKTPWTIESGLLMAIKKASLKTQAYGEVDQKRLHDIGGKIERRLQDEGINYNYEKDIVPIIHDYILDAILSDDEIVDEFVKETIDFYKEESIGKQADKTFTIAVVPADSISVRKYLIENNYFFDKGYGVSKDLFSIEVEDFAEADNLIQDLIKKGLRVKRVASLNKQSQQVGKVYKLIKSCEVPYFRWEYPPNVLDLTWDQILDAASDIESLITESDDTVQYVAVTGIGGSYVFASQNLAEEDLSYYQPSSKHIYIIPNEVFADCFSLVKSKKSSLNKKADESYSQDEDVTITEDDGTEGKAKIDNDTGGDEVSVKKEDGTTKTYKKDKVKKVQTSLNKKAKVPIGYWPIGTRVYLKQNKMTTGTIVDYTYLDGEWDVVVDLDNGDRQVIYWGLLEEIKKESSLTKKAEITVRVNIRGIGVKEKTFPNTEKANEWIDKLRESDDVEVLAYSGRGDEEVISSLNKKADEDLKVGDKVVVINSDKRSFEMTGIIIEILDVPDYNYGTIRVKLDEFDSDETISYKKDDLTKIASLNKKADDLSFIDLFKIQQKEHTDIRDAVESTLSLWTGGMFDAAEGSDREKQIDDAIAYLKTKGITASLQKKATRYELSMPELGRFQLKNLEDPADTIPMKTREELIDFLDSRNALNAINIAILDAMVPTSTSIEITARLKKKTGYKNMIKKAEKCPFKVGQEIEADDKYGNPLTPAKGKPGRLHPSKIVRIDGDYLELENGSMVNWKEDVIY